MNDKMFKYHIATILSSLYDWIALSNEGEAEREREKKQQQRCLINVSNLAAGKKYKTGFWGSSCMLQKYDFT